MGMGNVTTRIILRYHPQTIYQLASATIQQGYIDALSVLGRASCYNPFTTVYANENNLFLEE